MSFVSSFKICLLMNFFIPELSLTSGTVRINDFRKRVTFFLNPSISNIDCKFISERICFTVVTLSYKKSFYNSLGFINF